MKRRLVFLIIAVVALAGAVLYFRQPSRTEREQQILALVARQEIENYAASYPVIFLSIDGADASPTFMLRLVGTRVTPRKSSAAVRKGMEYYDRKTGEFGIRVSIHDLKWLGANRTQVKAGYYASGKAAMWKTYIIVFQDGDWEIDQEKMDGVARVPPQVDIGFPQGNIVSL